MLAATLLLIAAPVPAQTPASAPAPAVVVERIALREAAAPLEFIARVEAIEAVDIRARVQGFLRAVHFEAGEAVTGNQPLFEIEAAGFQAAVAAARAQLARAEAARDGAQRTLARTQELATRGTAAQAALDDAQTSFAIARADVQAAQAALRSAELDLSYTSIGAPIAGEIGRALYTRGNLVGPDSGVLARIVQIDPIRIVFSVAEGRIVTLRQRASRGDAVDTDALQLSLRLPNGSPYPHAGRIDHVASEVSAQTGTVAVRIAFPNPDRLLMPGQHVTLLAREGDSPMLPVVPQTAVLQDREGRFVYLLEQNDTVTRRRIATGARIGDGWAVTQGLSGGERVVVQGIQRLSEGISVQPSERKPAGTTP